MLHARRGSSGSSSGAGPTLASLAGVSPMIKPAVARLAAPIRIGPGHARRTGAADHPSGGLVPRFGHLYDPRLPPARLTGGLPQPKGPNGEGSSRIGDTHV